MRRAVIEIANEIVADVLPILIDHGLRIETTMAGHQGRQLCRFIITGESLPEGCDALHLQTVDVLVKVETYGRQRINRVSAITVIPPQLIAT